MEEPQTPFTATIDALTGTGAPEAFDTTYRKQFSEIAAIYADAAAAGAVPADALAYEVHSNARTGRPGELIVGTSVLAPNLVGDEFAMTRGHIHEVVNRAEIYFGLSGSGVLLLEDWSGTTIAAPLGAGQLVYVPGGWIHRSVNVGTQPLVSLFCFSSDAGQDYSIIERSRGMAKSVVPDGAGGWTLRDNPDYIPRAPLS